MLMAFYAISEPLALPANLSSAWLDALRSGYPSLVALVIGASAMMLVIALVKNQLAKRESTFTSMSTSPTAA